MLTVLTKHSVNYCTMLQGNTDVHDPHGYINSQSVYAGIVYVFALSVQTTTCSPIRTEVMYCDCEQEVCFTVQSLTDFNLR